MTTATLSATPQTADDAARLPATPRHELDVALAELARNRRGWARTPATERVELIDELLASFARVADRWVAACIEAEGIPPANPAAAEEWIVGPYFIFRNLRLLRTSLDEIARLGRPQIPGPVVTRADGQVTAQVFPAESWDRLFYSGVTAEVWMEPGVSEEELPETMAVAYHEGEPEGAVALVLGAGNVSSIGPMDALYKLFVENEVVLYKAHPVNDYLGPLLAEGFAPLVRRGLLQVVYGGSDVGAYLCHHPTIESIHVTGSNRTYEAIVFGPGEEGRKRKAAGQPLLDKPVSAELGNVSPVIVVPGPWSASDVEYHAENLVSMLTNNAGFNCNATRVIVTHASWPQRGELLDAMRRLLGKVPTRRAYYPGAEERWHHFVSEHPEAEQYGDTRFAHLPWTLIPDLDPEAEEAVTYTTEAFCGVFGETPIEADDPVEFIQRAVAFADQRLWGSLNITLLVHPDTLADPRIGAAVEQAIAGLTYGTVSVNHWAAAGYGLVITPWGAFPGHPPTDIQSGVGVVHNTLMFSRPQKAVVRAPFRVWPKPPWFVTHRTAHKVAEGLTRFEADRSPWRLFGIFRAALAG